MSKITIQLGFYFQNEHYAQVQAFIPRSEAIKIPGLRVDEYQLKIPKNQENQVKSNYSKNKKGSSKMSKSQRSQSKKDQSQEQNQEDFQNQQNQMDVEDQGQQVIEDDIQAELQEQMEQEKLMKYLEEDQSDQDDIDDEDLSSISKSMSVIRTNNKTKRQKGQKKDLMQLPDRRPRKDKNFDQANQILRRQQKEIKRKQYLKKQIEAQQKATLDKILNQTGKKLKMREQKQNIQIKQRYHKEYKTLGDVPKFIMKYTQQGDQIMIHKTQVFDQKMLRTPQIKMKQPCSKCGIQVGKYKMRTTQGLKFACSLNCYKMIC